MADPVGHPLTAPIPTSPNSAAVLDVAMAAAGASPVGSEHLLWALFNVEGAQAWRAGKVSHGLRTRPTALLGAPAMRPTHPRN